MIVEMKLCECCEEKKALEPHACPLAEEVYGSKHLCTCCSECSGNCADNI